MWRDIALANREMLRNELDRYRAALDRMAAALDRGDGMALEAAFAHAAKARRAWGARSADPLAAAGDDDA
jgi:prephenate dehydrogenase